MDNGRMTKGGPRLRDVAEAAGVSVATASKALNGRQDVSPATRDKVLRASTQLSFRPNRAAQQLQGGPSGTVGLIANDLDGRFSIPIMMGAEDGFGIENVSVFLTDARGDLIRERHHLEALMARGVDGFIFVGSRTDPRPPIAIDVPVPVVHVYAPSEEPEALSFVPDNVGAGRMATRHLLDLGREKLALISGDPGYAATTDRHTGIREVLDEAGKELVAPVRAGEWSEAWGRRAVRDLLASGADFDGLICGSDQIARGALDSLARAGVAVPEHVAVVSHDNWEVLATECTPQLTTVDMRFRTLGQSASQALLRLMNGEKETGVVTLPCSLVVRESTLGS